MHILRVGLLLLLLACGVAAAERSSTQVEHFKKLTGYPHGRPGYVVDHIIPLCAGGIDAPSNMQWQLVADAKVKDRFEVALCRALHQQGYRVTKQP